MSQESIHIIIIVPARTQTIDNLYARDFLDSPRQFDFAANYQLFQQSAIAQGCGYFNAVHI
jgi:hypothetical protein